MTPCPYLVARIMKVMDSAFDPTFREAWNRRQVSDALSLPSTHAIVIDANGEEIETDPLRPDSREPSGFVLTRNGADEEELLLIAVLPEFRRCGLGETLIDRLLKKARARGTKRMFLEMRRGNPAVYLYKKIGFEPIGERPNYYSLSNGSQVDAITFGMTL